MLRENVISNDVVELRNSIRGDFELLKERIAFLKGPEKLLMKMRFHDGYKIYEIARCAGVCESTISRKLRKISHRLMSSKVSAFLDNKNLFDSLERKIVKDFLREGLSQRQISGKRNITRYRVRKAIDKLESLSR